MEYKSYRVIFSQNMVCVNKKFVFDLEIKYISRQHDREIFFLQYAMYKFTCNRMTHPKR